MDNFSAQARDYKKPDIKELAEIMSKLKTETDEAVSAYFEFINKINHAVEKEIKEYIKDQEAKGVTVSIKDLLCKDYHCSVNSHRTYLLKDKPIVSVYDGFGIIMENSSIYIVSDWRMALKTA